MTSRSEDAPAQFADSPALAESVTQQIRIEDQFALATAKIHWRAEKGQMLPLLFRAGGVDAASIIRPVGSAGAGFCKFTERVSNWLRNRAAISRSRCISNSRCRSDSAPTAALCCRCRADSSIARAFACEPRTWTCFHRRPCPCERSTAVATPWRRWCFTPGATLGRLEAAQPRRKGRKAGFLRGIFELYVPSAGVRRGCPD